jgi:hypothetical protein
MVFAVDKLAAFIAHRLNAETDTSIRLEPGALYAQLTGALVERYAEVLLSHAAYAWRMGVEEAAERYFNTVVDRGTWIVGAATVCMGHRVFLATCRRGASVFWKEAELTREQRPAGKLGPALLPSPEFAAVGERLAHLPQSVSPGNAAASVRERDGPIDYAWEPCQWQCPRK